MVEIESLRRFADIVIRRGCGFGAIGIVTMMVAFVGQPGLSMQCGAILFGIMAAILAIKAGMAPRHNFKRTELWLMIKKEPPALPPDRLQQLIGGVMAERFVWHARLAGGIAVAMFAAAMLFRLAAA